MSLRAVSQGSGTVNVSSVTGVLPVVNGGTGTATAAQSSFVTLVAGNVTTTSASLVDITGAAITITTGANRVLCGFSGSISNGNLGATTYMNLLVDAGLAFGTDGLQFIEPVIGYPVNCGFTFMTAALSAGSHTFKVQWKNSAGTSTLYAAAGTAAHFWCRELIT